jgi:hypothetical protein
MGFLAFGLVLWLVKSARNRFAKSSTRLKKSISGEYMSGPEYDHSAMEHVKDKPGQYNRTRETKWADACLLLHPVIGILI